MRNQPSAASSTAAACACACAAAALAFAVALAGSGEPPSRCDLRDRLIGSWKVLSARIFYDAGGGGALGGTVSRRLTVGPDGEWAFGTSGGKWSVRPIGPDDWKRWGIEPYGPSSGLVLSGWSGGEVSGPIEESDVGPTFIWVIYRAEPPAVAAPGTVHLKLGRS